MAFTCTVYCFHRKYINRQLFTILKSASSPQISELAGRHLHTALAGRVEEGLRGADKKPDPLKTKIPNAPLLVYTLLVHICCTVNTVGMIHTLALEQSLPQV